MKITVTLLGTLIGFISTPVFAQETEMPTLSAAPAPAPAKVNDGTDPTQLTTQADVAIEHLDLRNGFNSETLTRLQCVANRPFSIRSLGIAQQYLDGRASAFGI